jgi:hypothetical protein
MSTGALQSMIYLGGKRPFERPVILGSELVSFSAILTCRHAGIRPVAMVEENARITAWRFAAALPRLCRLPVFLGSRLLRIHGQERVEGVTLSRPDGRERDIAADGVIVSGDFTPEATLFRMGHLQVDSGSGGPLVDQFGRCSDPDFFAAGNVLRPVETAGWSWREGVAAGDAIADSLAASLPRTGRSLAVEARHPAIKLAVPQRIALPAPGGGAQGGMTHIQLRLNRAVRGRLSLRDATGEIWSKSISGLPERRLLVPLDGLIETVEGDTLTIAIEESA